MSIGLALADAALNCARDGATTTITLKSGVQLRGELQRSSDPITGHLRTATGGWTTFLVDEVAAVESERARR